MIPSDQYLASQADPVIRQLCAAPPTGDDRLTLLALADRCEEIGLGRQAARYRCMASGGNPNVED